MSRRSIRKAGTTARISGLRIGVLAIVIAGCVIAASGTTPEGVSPGSANRFAAIRAECPTFSWSAVEGASHFELVAYRLPDGTDLSAGFDLSPNDEVLYTRVAGSATSWTPGLEQCLGPGGRYVWFVRAVTDDDAIEATAEWSAGRFFSVAAAPSAAEIEHALEVLRSVTNDQGSSFEDPTDLIQDDREVLTISSRAGMKGEPGSPKAGRSVPAATAAIRGEIPDPTGETYGLVGISDSPNGAGVGAANTAGGADLVLDGSADLLVDAELYESGIDRRSATPQSFNIANSDGGGMTLEVNGVEVTTTATDRDALGDLSCAGGELAKWNGSGWVCDDDFDTDTLAGLSCGSGQVAKWTGSTWACAPDVDTNTDTLAGLSCGGGQVAKWNGSSWACGPDENTLGALGCTTDQVAKWNGSAWVCAADEDTEYTFGPGLVVDNGQVVIDPSAHSTRISYLDTQDPQAGLGNSLAIGADGLGLISYFSYTSTSLKVAHCDDAPCEESTISTLVSGTTVNETSLAIGADGLAIVAFHDDDTSDLKVAHCNDVACTSASITPIDSANDVGSSPSLAIGADGLAIISYFDATNFDLKVAHCDNVDCSSATVIVVDAFLNVGEFTALAIGADGLPIIAYYSGTLDSLKVAHCEDLTCSARTTRTVDDSASDVGLYPSIAIGIDGLALISYHNATDLQIKTAHCEDIACDSATFGIVKWENGERHTAIAIGADGLALIGLFDGYYDELQVAHCLDTRCWSTEISTLGTVWLGSNGNLSLAVGPDGRGLLSHTFTPGAGPASVLGVAHLPVGF